MCQVCNIYDYVRRFNRLIVFITELNIIDTLYRMLRDKNPFVVLNAARSLNEMHAGEGGMVVNRNIAHTGLTAYICSYRA